MKPSEDYLFQSGAIDNELLQIESVNDWNRMMETTDIDEEFKLFMTYFYIPFHISMMKCQLNHSYVTENDYMLDHLDHEVWKHEKDYISPTLRLLYKDITDIPMGYPTKFTACFPDVVSWAMKGEGLLLIKSMFEEKGISYYITNNSLTAEALILIVQLYLGITGKELECGILS